LATGNIVFIEFTEQAKGIMFVVLLVVFVLTQGITLYSAHERASLFNPTADGFIVGVGFMEAIVVFLLYGFRP
jgi:Ni,Fe-hydrogenase I cytochrome b subunit